MAFTPTGVAGGPIYIDDWAADLDPLTALGSVWVDYSGTFTLTATTVNPTKGNSTYAAQYLIVHAKLTRVRMRVTVGSTFVAGTGTYRFSLPSTATADASSYGVGAAYINDSGTALRSGIVVGDGRTGDVTVMYNNAAATITALTSAGSGTAWAVNDFITIDYAYEPA